jgi:predicted DsbA family dithiol-disulfide isomerase
MAEMLVVPVAHDFTCPWCWIGHRQAQRMAAEFGVTFDWLGYELYPESLPWPEPGTPEPPNPNRPVTPSRLQLAYAAEGMDPPTVQRPRRMRIHNALEAVEHAKALGVEQEAVDRLYLAYWTRGMAIGEADVVCEVLQGLVEDLDDLRQAMAEKRYEEKIVPYDDEAYARGVYNVPTFFIGGERYAEQPYVVLQRALKSSLK